MAKAASLVKGEHDFSSFRGSGCGAKHPVRTVGIADITRFDAMHFMTATFRGNFIKFRIEANAFLRHMVRNIAGTLVEVGKGTMSIETFEAVLNARDRTIAGPTAPAHGLFLEKVTY
jgi:tRNA pseudouridine38-40 synthase